MVGQDVTLGSAEKAFSHGFCFEMINGLTGELSNKTKQRIRLISGVLDVLYVRISV